MIPKAKCFVMLALLQVLMPLLRSPRFCYYRFPFGNGISLQGSALSENIFKICGLVLIRLATSIDSRGRALHFSLVVIVPSRTVTNEVATQYSQR